MSGVPVWPEAVGLPWLRPSTTALLALVSNPPDGQAVLGDPAAIAHVLRFARPSLGPNDPLVSSAILSQPGLAENAAVLLHESHLSAPDWATAPALLRVNTVASAAAQVGAELARSGQDCSPDAASAVARLATLGWYALQSTRPDAVEAGPSDRRVVAAAGVATRRLLARWRLPKWVTATISSLQFRRSDAMRLGAPSALFDVVQAAIAAAERRYGSVGLTDPARVTGPLSEAANQLVQVVPSPGASAGDEPVAKDILVRLLHVTAAARRASGAIWLAEAEDRVDVLCEQLANLRADFDMAVRDEKLAALAEFAAGASHEINNPLAVISGQAQLLLSQELDPDRRQQLAAIVRQTRRVHDLLQGTLQFARPTPPNSNRVAFDDLIRQAIATLHADAIAKDVSLDLGLDLPTELDVRVDAGQVRQAVVQIVRNAIDAAPRGGWVRVGLCRLTDRLELTVEDNGPGLSLRDANHLFDPFYSGRSAGRGRGLGLSIAWRLARINGGDVRHEPAGNGPTRFVLTLPLALNPGAFSRKCA